MTTTQFKKSPPPPIGVLPTATEAVDCTDAETESYDTAVHACDRPATTTTAIIMKGLGWS